MCVDEDIAAHTRRNDSSVTSCPCPSAARVVAARFFGSFGFRRIRFSGGSALSNASLASSSSARRGGGGRNNDFTSPSPASSLPLRLLRVTVAAPPIAVLALLRHRTADGSSDDAFTPSVLLALASGCGCAGGFCRIKCCDGRRRTRAPSNSL